MDSKISADSEKYNSARRFNFGNTLYISESNIDLNKYKNKQSRLQSEFLTQKYDGSLLVLKEKFQQKLRVFHICENNDINTLKGIETSERKISHSVLDGNSDENDIVFNQYDEEDSLAQPKEKELTPDKIKSENRGKKDRKI